MTPLTSESLNGGCRLSRKPLVPGSRASCAVRRRAPCPTPRGHRTPKNQPQAPRLDWADRVLLAALIQRLPAALRGHRLVAPATVLRWHRSLVTKKLTYTNCSGRLPLDPTIAALIERMAREQRDLGLPAHPRRTPQTRPPHRRINHPQDPQTAANTIRPFSVAASSLATQRQPEAQRCRGQDVRPLTHTGRHRAP